MSLRAGSPSFSAPWREGRTIHRRSGLLFVCAMSVIGHQRRDPWKRQDAGLIESRETGNQ
jgi:hypothetical protein